MSDMKTLDQRGVLNSLLVPLILVIVFFLGAAGFGYWAFAERQDYKNNSDQKVAVAVEAAEKRTQAADAKQYAEEAKRPLKTYVGPASFGAVTVQYPKTWSANVVERTNNASRPIDAFFHPDFVPDTSNQDKSFALRIQLVGESYDQVLDSYNSAVKSGKATVAPYRLAKVPTIIGSVVTGQIDSRKQGTMVILPIRNMTLKIWADSSEYLPDLNNIILPNFSFTP